MKKVLLILAAAVLALPFLFPQASWLCYRHLLYSINPKAKTDHCTSCSSELVKVDFYQSMQRHKYVSFKKFKKLYKENAKVLPTLAKNYNDFYLNASHDSTNRIPKIIHQIWLGGKLPEKYNTLIETWAHWNGWEYKLWTDKDVAEMELYNRAVFDRCRNYGEKADVLRLEILYNEGGLYVDTDFECYNPSFFDHLHQTLDFYAGLNSHYAVNNAIIGAAPHHPILKKMIEGMQENFEKNINERAVASTGPVYFTDVIYSSLLQGDDSKVVLFPVGFFYPTSWSEIRKNKQLVFVESQAFHYWDGSWEPERQKPTILP